MFERAYAERIVGQMKTNLARSFLEESRGLARAKDRPPRAWVLDLAWMQRTIEAGVSQLFHRYLEYCREEHAPVSEHLDLPKKAAEQLIDECASTFRGVWSVATQAAIQLDRSDLETVCNAQRDGLLYRINEHFEEAKRGRVAGNLVYQVPAPTPATRKRILDRVNQHPIVTLLVIVATIGGFVLGLLEYLDVTEITNL